MTPQEENAYIVAVRSGNTQAFAYLVQRHKNFVYNLCFRILKHKEDAEEIAQDVFLKAFQQLHTFQGKAKFSTWLYRIAYHTALNKAKKKKIWTESLQKEENEDSPALQIADDTFENQFQLLQKTEKRLYIQEAMKTLSEQEAVIITLYYFAEHSLEEIEEIIALDKNNIKVKLHRARKKLYQALVCLLPKEFVNLVN